MKHAVEGAGGAPAGAENLCSPLATASGSAGGDPGAARVDRRGDGEQAPAAPAARGARLKVGACREVSPREAAATAGPRTSVPHATRHAAPSSAPAAAADGVGGRAHLLPLVLADAGREHSDGSRRNVAEGVSISDQIRAEARALAFDAVGFARADVPLAQDAARYAAFVEAGMHGDMTWLGDHAPLRATVNGEGILPGARSVICVARRYQRPPPEEDEASSTAMAGIARYARGRDYHKFLRKRLRRLATFVRSLGAPSGPYPERVEARPILDDAPVLERAWAARAGLGFVGKNGMIIVPGTGSMVLLGEVVTTLALPPDAPIAERCGTCTRCLDACPTAAFAAPFVLDARRCVSYLTIERRAPADEALRPGIGGHLFGCDDCQTVCPFNAGAGARAAATLADGDPFKPLERWSRTRLEDLLAIDAAAWSVLSEGSPLRRVSAAVIARNAAIVLGNLGDRASLPALRVALAHEDEGVRDAARWAVARLARACP